MNILVTGGGGFLGSHIIKELKEQGHQVKSFSRHGHQVLKDWEIENIQGNICDFKALDQALKKIDVVFHTASKVAMWGRWSDFYETNVRGTENLIKACQKNGVQKLIYTSTPSVVFEKDDLAGVDESHPYPSKFLGHYAESKSLAEKLVLKAHGKNNLATIALRPHLIFGEKDPHLIPRLIKLAKAKKLRIIGNGKNLVDVVYVENAAFAHIKAMEKLSLDSPVGGKSYFIGQENPVPLWDFINEILSFKGLDPIEKKISVKKAVFLGNVCEKLYSSLLIYKKEPPMTRFVALQLSKSHYFSHQNAFQDLGYYPKISTKSALEKLKKSLA